MIAIPFPIRLPGIFAACFVLPWLLACSNSNPPASCSTPGGPVSGAPDTHCGTRIQAIDEVACHPPDAGAPDAGAMDDGGMAEEFPPAMVGTEADDDDCKYHIKWSATPVCQNTDVTLTVIVTDKTTGSPAAGAMPSAEVFLGDTHPAPNTNATATEGPLGTYKIGPIRFDASGQWTVRFHFFEMCTDSEDSPHGHGAFFVQVP